MWKGFEDINLLFVASKGLLKIYFLHFHFSNLPLLLSALCGRGCGVHIYCLWPIENLLLSHFKFATLTFWLVWKGLWSKNLLFVKVKMKSTIESEICVERVAEYKFTVCES